MADTTLTQNPGVMIMLFAIVSLTPFFIVTATSFVKLSAVLSILRSALGTPQIPPNIVVTGIALVLTILIMMPVFSEMVNCMNEDCVDWSKLSEPNDLQEKIEKTIRCVTPPLKTFLKKHIHDSELMMIQNMADDITNSTCDDDNLILLVTAFLLSELKEAFQIGFLIFLPFIVIDLVIANILQALGMVMMSPTTISLPFKLLLFVLADGWYLIIEGLLAGYI
jgi:type III secretion protein R